MSTPNANPELGTPGSALAWNEKARALAVQVQQTRRQRRMSSWALAEQAGLSAPTVQDIEHARPVEQPAVEAVCRVLSLDAPKLDGDPVHTFALLIRQRREQARLKQYQLAALSGLAAKTIKEVERAARWPRSDTCAALLSVRTLHLKAEDIAPFVTDLDEASELARTLRQLAEDRVSKNPKLIGRTHRPRPERDEKNGTDEKEMPESEGTWTPNPTKPRPRLLFLLRVYVDGSIIFTPALKVRRR